MTASALLDTAVVRRMLDLVAAHSHIGGRDAVHAATALEHAITTVISPDAAFDNIGGFTRVDPRELDSFLES